MHLGLLLPGLLLLPLEGTGAAQEPDRGMVREDLADAARPLRDAPLDALLAALGDDGVEGNAEAACRELQSRAAGAAGMAARARLVAALAEADPQRRFLAAWLLAFLGPGDTELETVVRTLIPILGDDRVPGNGMMAAEALRALGDRRTPWVKAALRLEQGQVQRMLHGVAGNRYPYQGSTAYRQPARDVYLLGPSRAADWAPPRLSPPADSEDARIRDLLGRMGDIADAWVVDWASVELQAWHGETMLPYAAAALDSPDRRTRQFAASLLRQAPADFPMPPQMYAVQVEGLADDAIRWNAQCGAYWLRRHYAESRLDVLAGLRSADPVVRWRCADVAARGGERDLGLWVPALIEALGDDAIPGNALDAARLLGARPETRPWLEEALASPDPQRRDFAARILVIQDR